MKYVAYTLVQVIIVNITTIFRLLISLSDFGKYLKLNYKFSMNVNTTQLKHILKLNRITNLTTDHQVSFTKFKSLL